MCVELIDTPPEARTLAAAALLTEEVNYATTFGSYF